MASNNLLNYLATKKALGEISLATELTITSLDYIIALGSRNKFAQQEPLNENLGMTISELAEFSDRAQSVVSSCIKDLRIKGLVYKTLGHPDERQHFISLTPEGKALYESMLERTR